MTIMESAIAMNNDYIECTNTLGKIMLFAEASYKEYEINLKEVALKVIKENGTEDDFDFLATEAANGYIERARKTIEKIVESVKKFVDKCKARLIEMVDSAKTRTAIEKVDAACKKNSKLRSSKVEYQNTDRQIGVIQQGIDAIRKKVSKIKAKGYATEEDGAEIDKIEADTMRKVAAVSVITAVTLGTAVAIYYRCNSKSEIEATLDNDIHIGDVNIDITEDNTKSTVTASVYTKAAGTIAKLQKDKAAKRIIKSTSIIAAIKNAISKAKGKVESENLEVQESALEDLPMFSYVVESTEDVVDDNDTIDESEVVEEVETESVGSVEGLDLDEYFSEMCNELFNSDVTESAEDKVENVESEVIDVEESTESEEGEVNMTEAYMEQLEREVFGDETEVVTESTETNTEDNHIEEAVTSLIDDMENLL